jgi:hypothetical protein
MCFSRPLLPTRARLLLGAAGLALLVSCAAPAQTAARELGPGGDLCGAINTLQPGDELVLRPGDYRGPCTIRIGGRPGAPIVIRAQDPAQKPRIVYAGRESNVMDVKASHVILRGLRFGPTQEDVDGVRVFRAEEVTVEECEFEGMGGIAVVANHANVRGLVVRNNTVRRSRATGMYFGCHDGATCRVTDLLVEGNSIHGVAAPPDSVGYGLEIKLNSAGIVRGNVVVDTKGPGIMVYGSQSPSLLSTVERNFVVGSRESAGIVVGGGPALVRNNITLGSSEAGISLEDYKRRGLLRRVVVVHNTVVAGEILVPANGPLDAMLVNNAVQGRGSMPALPPRRAGLELAGNVDCTGLACFANVSSRDFSPGSGSPLVGAGLERQEPWFPAADFFGTRRPERPSAGAVERAAGPVPLGPGRP